MKKDYNYDLQDFVVSKIETDSKKYHVDIGCGDRHLSSVIARKGSLSFYKGIEKDEEWLENNPSVYDFAYMLDVIEHLDEQTLDMYFTKVKEYLKQEGTLILSTPHIRNLYQISDFWGEPEHKRPYTKEAIQVICDRYDLYIDQHHKFHWFANPFKRIINKLLGLDNWNKDIYFIKKAVQ